VYSLSSIAVRSIRAARVDLETCRHYEVSQVELINPKWWQEQPV